MTLLSCGACRRHVRPEDAQCPFCASAIDPSPEPIVLPRGMSRAQMVAAVATAASLAACGGGSAARGDGTVIDVTTPDASAPIATSAPTSTGFATPPPTRTANPPPPNDDVELDPRRRNWHRNRPPCGGPKGPCPPYGCVCPDEACDVVRA
jgi:hypothetical protein